MIKISDKVQETIENDSLALSLAKRGLLNSSAYAREIKPEVDKALYNNVKVGSIVVAVRRYVEKLDKKKEPKKVVIQTLSVYSQLEALSFERTEKISKEIGATYKDINPDIKTFLAVTQGLNEITIVASKEVAETFRKRLKTFPKIYDISNLVGVAVKFSLEYVKIPNVFFTLIRRLSVKNINIVEVVSTATELTFIIDKDDLSPSLEQLQKEV